MVGAIGFLGASALGTARPFPEASSIVHVITVESIISPVSAEYIIKSLGRAEEENAHCLIVELDTPGGLLESTRQITKSFLSARIPVIIYVAPSGARAASAGVYISYAAHLVAMAPSTNIGAATPVNLGGSSPDSASTLSHKITNDAVAQIKALAAKRGRNAEWAEKAVREAVSITETEALKLNVINYISPSLDSLLNQVDGVEVEVASGKVKLATRNARVVRREMNLRYRLLEKISNPNVAFILMTLGFWGIFFELSHPGAVFPGVVGALFLIIGFFALQTLPVNYAGLLLILLALVMFILEVKVVSYGMLTVGGIISMVIGSLMLFEQPPDNFGPLLQVSLSVILTVVGLTATFFILVFSLAVRAQRRHVTTGSEGLVGEIGIAGTNIEPEGSVRVHGEIWRAFGDEPIKKGETVNVVAVEGLRLKVVKATRTISQKT